ncbi:MAG: hypothetical protein ACOX46_03480, partial [Limnochordia bacterium]
MTATAAKTIEVVNMAPEVTILRPTAGQVLVGEQVVQWRAEDADDAHDLEITLEYRALPDGDWQQNRHPCRTRDNSSGMSLSLRGGRYVLRITAVDPWASFGRSHQRRVHRGLPAANTDRGTQPGFRYGDVLLRPAHRSEQLYVYSIAGRLVYSAQLSAAAHSHEWNLQSGGTPVRHRSLHLLH